MFKLDIVGIEVSGLLFTISGICSNKGGLVGDRTKGPTPRFVVSCVRGADSEARSYKGYERADSDTRVSK